MSEVAREGRTVIFVSHNLTAIKNLCQRVYWFDKGEIARAGETGQMVFDYVQEGAVSTLEQCWSDPATAPGNERIRTHSARVRSPQLAAEITVGSPIDLEFGFWNQQADALLNFTLHVHTIEGLYVFAASSEVKPRRKGLAKEIVRIPPNFLNDGIYSVSLQVVQDSKSIYIHPEILAFEVLDEVRQGSWFGKWPGVVRPKLEWISESDFDKGNCS